MKVILLTLLIAIPISLTAKWEKIESPKSIQNLSNINSGSDFLVGNNNDVFFSFDEGRNFQKVASFPQNSKFGSFYDTEHLYKSKNGKYFFMTIDSLYELDTSNYRYKVFNIGYDMITKEYFSEKVGDGFLDEQYFVVVNQIAENEYENNFVKFEVDDSISMKIVGDLETGFNPIRSNTGDYLTYFKNSSSYISLYKPIEPERLAYYTSVESTESRNYLWTNAPYPQPTNTKVKVDIWWDSQLPINTDDIEIYNLQGVKVSTSDQLNITKESNWNGNIIWDASNQNPGIYLMKIKHGTETRTRKIIITE